ncbi:MAG: type IV secretion system DNA-binding domain-containing protein [Patescibacteria group bacterium]
MEEDKNITTYFAKTNFRNKQTVFGIKKGDRTKHMYVIGKTGTGKTTLLENIAVQDIRNGEGVGVIDPHGSFVEKMLDFVPKERIKDVIYINPSDMDCPIALNIMEDVDGTQRHLVASGLMGVFKKMWPDVWSARMEYILNNAILALLEYPNATLLGVNRMLSDKDYRKAVVDNITDPVVKAFWTQEFAKYTERFAAEATPAIQNKVGQFTANPLIRNIIGQPKSSFDFRKAMDEKKIILMNLSKGRIGELNSKLLGAMLVTKIYLASMSRAKDPEVKWPDFYLHVDEFQNFATESFKDILSESRKYGLGLILAHQYIAQMEDEGVSEAVFGNVGTHIVFRVGPADAVVLETEFSPEFLAENIVNLGMAHIYLKLSIDGMPSRPFSAVTLPPIKIEGESYKKEIIEASRKTYCTLQTEVTEAIAKWHEPIERPKKEGREEEKEEPTSPKLFEAECSVCGKKTVVPFEPDGKRPIFCPKHKSYSSQGGSGKKQEEEVVKPRLPEKKEVSLLDLNKKTTGFRKDFGPTREKSSPDFKGLRELLSEITPENQTKAPIREPDRSQEERGEEKVLRPGESVRF